jgi:HEAT repeat protein
VKFRLSLVLLLVLAGVVSAQQAASVPSDGGPQYVPSRDKNHSRETFGDKDDIALLMSLAQDADPMVREKIVRDLGQTHNVIALPLIEAFLKDSDVNVRGTAVAAAYELRTGEYKQGVLKGLKDKDPQVQARAMSIILQGMEVSAGDVMPLIAGTDKDLQRQAIMCMNQLKQALPAETLKGLLTDASPAIRLQAAQNALLASPAQASGILQEIFDLSGKDTPSIRAAALAVLGKNAFNGYKEVIESASRDKDPQIRRGAIWAMQYGSKTGLPKGFIQDPSPMVSLAAVKAAGELKCQDCIDNIVQVMLTAQDTATHEIACQSLEQIGSAQVAAIAGKLLVTLPQGEKKPVSLDERNVISACKILAKLKSREVLDARLEMLRTLPINSNLSAHIVYSLSMIDEKSAIPAIRKLLAENVANAAAAATANASADNLYGGDCVIASIQALVALGDKDPQTVKLMHDITLVRGAAGLGLSSETAAVLQALPQMYTDQTQGMITETILGTMGQAFSYSVRFEAIKLAGKYKITEATEPLRQILAAREENNIMQAAAWSLQQITGQAVEIPELHSNPGDWTVTRK